MQLVQRAMLPDTGPMELAEVLLGGLLWRLPEPEPGPAADPADGHWYEFADGVREMLLRSLDQGAAALVLKHCSEFVERHFGKGARNFSALAVAQLSGRADGGPAPDPAEPPGAAAPEPELFAEVPARVVRWYRPVPVESGPLAEADRLLRLWHAQGDPTLLHEARELAGPAAAAAPETAEGVRARLVLGGVLHALAGTEAVRHAPDAGTGLLEEAAVLLTTAAGHATPGGAAHTEAALELAAVHEALWRATGDAGRLARAEAVLTALPPGTAIRHLRLGRVLLAQAERETTAELLVPPPPEPNAGPAPRPGAGTRSEAGHGSARDAGADPVTEPRPPHGSDGGAGAGTGPSADLGTAFPFGPGSGGESGESAESGEEAVPAYGTGVLAGSFPGAPTHPGAAAGPDDSTGSDSTVRPDARTPTPSDREPASPAGRGGVTSPGGEPVSSAGGGSAASPGGEPIPSAGPGSVTPPDREPVASAGRGSATSPGGEPDDWPGSGSTARSDARTLTPSDREPASPAVRGSAASPGDEPVPSADRGSVTPPGGEPDDSPGSDSTARPDVRTLTPSDREPVSPAGRGGVTSPGGESVSSADLGSATPTGGEPVPSADRGSVTPPGGEPVSPADLGSATPPDREPVPPAGPGSVTSSGTGDAPRTEGAAGRQAASAPGTRTGARAAAELRTACALLESSGAPPGQRCAALLDLARALGLSRAPGVEVLGALDRAEATAGDDGLLLRCRTEQARARTALRDWAAADEAYAAAADLTGAYSPARCELLAEWGESLLGRARRDRTASSAGRAEAVLREAFAISTGPAAGRARLQLLLARALVLRFARQGFLPDLYESCHLLEQAARRAPDPTARAEAWLELGAARTTLHERSASAPLDDAAAAFTAALAEARRAAGDLPGSVLAARAAHRYGDVVERMGRPRAALTAYQEAAREWRELTARLAAVPWAEVRDTQERVARLSAPRAGGA
ncbi:hypothetical protein [Streptomyces eurocidicus]|nr:hypothetical protein [Streptomyces eurocidicus]